MTFWQSTDAALETKAATAAYAPAASFFGGQGARTVDTSKFIDPEKAIVEGYGASTWVYRCIRRKQDMIAPLRWVVRQYAPDGAHEDLHDHPAAWKWNQPSEEWPALWNMHRAAGFLSVAGNAFFGLDGPGVEDDSFDIEKFRDNDQSTIKVESPVGVTPRENVLGWVADYELDPPRGAARHWAPHSVIHVMLPALTQNGLLGMGELQALARAIDTDAAAHDWNHDSFGAGGMASWLMLDFTVTQDTIGKAVSDMEDRFRSRGRSRVPWIVEGNRDAAGKPDVELHRLGANAQELDWLNGLAFGRDEIVAGLGFHPADFSREHATRDNRRTNVKQAWEQAALPLLAQFTAWVSLKLLTPRERRDGMLLVPDLRGVRELKEDAKIVAETFDKVVGPGKLSAADGANFAGVELDLEKNPGYRDALRPLNARVVSEPAGVTP
ncbi:MAG: phage portal protein [bacterium]|nr:phage portal protein [bacterium]